MELRRIVALAALAGAIGLAAPAVAQEDAAALGRTFCEARLKGDDTATLALASSGLKAAIAEAMAKNDAAAKAEPDQEPPLGEGVPYQSFPDKPAKCEVGAVTSHPGGGEEVAIAYIFPDQPDGNWTDRIVVADDAGKKALDDVLYTEDSGGGSLRDALVQMFQEDDGGGEDDGGAD